MIGLRVEATGDDRAATALGAIAASMRDLRPFYEQAIEPDFYQWQESRFDTEGGDQRWARLSPAYAAWKARAFPGRKILVREGLLREGLTRRGGRFQVRRLDNATFEIGTRHPAAQFHQFGTSRMPRREIITLSGGDIRRWRDLGEAYFGRVVREAMK